MRLYNSLTRKKEEFKPLKSGAVSMYHCGPTVYDYSHIGNFRSFLLADILRRVFEFKDYKVNQVMNITDVDDKTIHRSHEEGITFEELTKKYTDAFLKDIKELNILRPKTLAKATEHIEQMVSLTESLLKKGLAYKGDDGSVYFKISESRDYGKLAGLENVDLKQGARIHSDEYTKEDARDFVLWKAWAESDGPVFWETSLGKGRPGWHLECSAMSMHYLNETFDIHTGGIDLIFPHHTNEIAQSEGSTGKDFVQIWLHNEFVFVNGEKMSKSKGNIITLADIIEKGFDPLAFRYWLLTAHYRSPVNFTWDALLGSAKALLNIQVKFDFLKGEAGEVSQEYLERFKNYIEDDLDTPRAIALIHDLLGDKSISDENKKETLLKMDAVLGLEVDAIEIVEIPDEIEKLAKEREMAREKEDWQKSDEIREKIKKLGFAANDTQEGTFLVPLKRYDNKK